MMEPSDVYSEIMAGECDSQQTDYCKELTGKRCEIHNFNDCPIATGEMRVLPENILNCEYHGEFFRQDLEIIDEGIRICPICYMFEMEARKFIVVSKVREDET